MLFDGIKALLTDDVLNLTGVFFSDHRIDTQEFQTFGQGLVPL